MKARAIVLTLSALFVFLARDVVAHPATGIVLDRAGNIYFSDLETIWKIDTAGTLSVFRAGVGGRHVHELVIDEHDNIYGEDLSYESGKFINGIWKMTADGRFEYLLAPTDKPPRGMSIWRDREGNSYWIDQNNHTKAQTLLLRRTPDGNVVTLAGGAYGHTDGKGTVARFSSVGGLAFGPDGSLYLADSAAVRKVKLDGTVLTLANQLDRRTEEDKPNLFLGLHGNLSGISLDSASNVFVADAENRRLFKITPDGKAEVLFRSDPPYLPNGVVVGPDGAVYILEVGFTLPSSWSGPRVRKLTADGNSTILATVGADGSAGGMRAVLARGAGTSTETFLTFFLMREQRKYGVLIVSAIVFSIGAIWWRRRMRQGRQRI